MQLPQSQCTVSAALESPSPPAMPHSVWVFFLHQRCRELCAKPWPIPLNGPARHDSAICVGQRAALCRPPLLWLGPVSSSGGRFSRRRDALASRRTGRGGSASRSLPRQEVGTPLPRGALAVQTHFCGLYFALLFFLLICTYGNQIFLLNFYKLVCVLTPILGYPHFDF